MKNASSARNSKASFPTDEHKQHLMLAPFIYQWVIKNNCSNTVIHCKVKYLLHMFFILLVVIPLFQAIPCLCVNSTSLANMLPLPVIIIEDRLRSMFKQFTNVEVDVKRLSNNAFSTGCKPFTYYSDNNIYNNIIRKSNMNVTYGGWLHRQGRGGRKRVTVAI